MDLNLDREISLTLRDGEAAVLFEFLSAASAAGSFATQAERIVVWRTICRLEKEIAFLFDPRWRELVAAARAEIERQGA